MQYRIGTISIANGDTTVTGVGTRFLANISTDCVLIADGDEEFYEITQVTDDTHLELGSPYLRTSRVNYPYVIVKDFTFYFEWPIIQSGSIQWPATLSESLRRIDRDLFAPPTNKASKLIRFVPQSEPPTPTEGVLYYADDIGGFCYYNGTEWMVLTSTPVP